eukprot:352329-Chlamydomonas_euryale.AAC.3
MPWSGFDYCRFGSRRNAASFTAAPARERGSIGDLPWTTELDRSPPRSILTQGTVKLWLKRLKCNPPRCYWDGMETKKTRHGLNNNRVETVKRESSQRSVESAQRRPLSSCAPSTQATEPFGSAAMLHVIYSGPVVYSGQRIYSGHARAPPS